MYVYMILTNTFLQAELCSKYARFFITGFLICHSFLDFLYIGGFPRFGVIDCPAANKSLFQITQLYSNTIMP